MSCIKSQHHCRVFVTQALIGDTKTILERLEKLEKAVFKSRAA
ncbi:MAG: hypothetical protein WC956_01625 [bacterium]